MLNVEEEQCRHGRWSWQPCEKCVAALGGDGAKVLLREIFENGYLNGNEPLRQRVLAYLFPPHAMQSGAPVQPTSLVVEGDGDFELVLGGTRPVAGAKP